MTVSYLLICLLDSGSILFDCNKIVKSVAFLPLKIDLKIITPHFRANSISVNSPYSGVPECTFTFPVCPNNFFDPIKGNKNPNLIGQIICMHHILGTGVVLVLFC